MGWAQRHHELEQSMLRRVTLDGSATHKTYFRLIFEAFRSRGSAPADKRVSKDEKRLDAKILRALKAISEPVGEALPEGELDVRARQLTHEGGALDLEQPEFKRLQTYVEETQWVAAMTDVATDLEDFLDTTEKLERPADILRQSPVEAAKPRRVRAG